MHLRAWSLVAVLGAAVVAGGFLLPRGNADDDLVSAVHRTLAARSFRASYTGASGTTTEDFEAPHRVRMTSGGGFDIITIGSTTYVRTTCTTPNGSESGYRSSHQSVPGTSSTFALLSLVSHARGARRVGHDRYAVSVQVRLPNARGKDVRMRELRTEATVTDGKVRELTVAVPHLGTTRAVLSHFGRVPPIVRPAGPSFDAGACVIAPPDLISRG